MFGKGRNKRQNFRVSNPLVFVGRLDKTRLAGSEREVVKPYFVSARDLAPVIERFDPRADECHHPERRRGTGCS